MNNSNFKGNCESCHYITSKGEFPQWDHVKYEVLHGITTVANVQGEFRFDQDVVTPLDEVFCEVSSGSDANGLAPYSPDNDEVWNEWTIKVTGEIENPFEFKISELPEDQLETHILKQHCEIDGIGGAMISNCEVTGLSIAKLVETAVPYEGVNCITFKTWDGANPSDNLQDLLPCENATLAFYLNGERLPAEFGFPAQLWVGNWSAAQYAKVVYEINFSTVPEDYAYTYYDEYEVNGAVSKDDLTLFVNNPNHVCLNVADGQIFELGEPITFEGYADAYSDTITSLEFSLDNGETWTKFETPDTTSDRWVYWYFTVDDLDMGSYVLTMRATSSAGRVSYRNVSTLFHVQ